MNFITYEQDGFVGVITINRPKALNAFGRLIVITPTKPSCSYVMKFITITS